MKKVLIISPHFPPVNAADMHRVRQTLPYLKDQDWEPTVLTVEPRYIEIVKDELLDKHIPKDIVIHKVKAFSTSCTRQFGLGNLGIRAFYQLYKKGCELLRNEKFDLIYFSTTVFSCLPLGRLWKHKFGVPFIIDMQDPWRNDYYLGVPKNLRPPKFTYAYHLDKWMESYTMPKVDGLVAVASGYIDALKSRYPKLTDTPSRVLTLGAHPPDLDIASSINAEEMDYNLDPSKINIVYAGVVPKNMLFSIEALMKALKKLIESDKKFADVQLHFVGTNYATGGYLRSALDELIEDYKLENNVTERPLRVPYFQALKLIQQCDLSILAGTTDKDYTASKLYPYIMTKKPMIAIFNECSSVVSILKKIDYGAIQTFNPKTDQNELSDRLFKELKAFVNRKVGQQENANELFDDYMSEYLAKQQVDFFEEVLDHIAKKKRVVSGG